jgi:hypothetical protein
MKTPDAVLQELWSIKDAEYRQSGNDGHTLVAQLRAQSAALRAGLQLKPLIPAIPQGNAPSPNSPAQRST